MNRHLKLSALACAALLSACGKDAVKEITGPVPGSQIKFFNFAVNAPGVNFYANTTKMTAISTTSGTESSLGTNYGSAGAGGLYTAITPGQYDIAAKTPAAGDTGAAVSHVATALESGKYYSYYQSGLYNSTSKTADAFLIEDDIPTRVDYAIADVRFVNAISNATGPIVLYVTNTDTSAHMPETAIGTGVGYKSASAFVALPEGAYNLSARYAGSSTSIVTRNGLGFSGGRAYTITIRGDATSSATATKPALDNTFNR